MAHRQSLGAASTLSTLRGLPAYTSRAPSIAGSQAPSTLPPQFSDSVSVAPSYNTNASAIVNIWDLQPLECDPDVYEFSTGSGPEPEDQPWLKWLIYARSSEKQFDNRVQTRQLVHFIGYRHQALLRNSVNSRRNHLIFSSVRDTSNKYDLTSAFFSPTHVESVATKRQDLRFGMMWNDWSLQRLGRKRRDLFPS